MKLIRLLRWITAIITYTHYKQTELRIAPVVLVVTDMSLSLRSSWRAVSLLLYNKRVVTWRKKWNLGLSELRLSLWSHARRDVLRLDDSRA